jgi:hypothetical protein
MLHIVTVSTACFRLQPLKSKVAVKSEMQGFREMLVCGETCGVLTHHVNNIARLLVFFLIFVF